MSKHRLTWRRHKRERWLSVTPHVYDLFCDGIRVGGAARYEHKGFGWSTPEDTALGIGFRNTYGDPVATMDEAKAACLAYVRACLAGKGESDR